MAAWDYTFGIAFTSFGQSKNAVGVDPSGLVTPVVVVFKGVGLVLSLTLSRSDVEITTNSGKTVIRIPPGNGATENESGLTLKAGRLTRHQRGSKKWNRCAFI